MAGTEQDKDAWLPPAVAAGSARIQVQMRVTRRGARGRRERRRRAGTERDSDAWLPPAVAAVSDWIEFQMRVMQQVGCVLAVARHGEVVFERAFGLADLG